MFECPLARFCFECCPDGMDTINLRLSPDKSRNRKSLGKSTLPVWAASSIGRCNTIQWVDATMLARENHRFGCTRSKSSQSYIPAGPHLISDFGVCFQCQAGSSLVLRRPIEITAFIRHVEYFRLGWDRGGIGRRLPTGYQTFYERPSDSLPSESFCGVRLKLPSSGRPLWSRRLSRTICSALYSGWRAGRRRVRGKG